MIYIYDIYVYMIYIYIYVYVFIYDIWICLGFHGSIHCEHLLYFIQRPPRRQKYRGRNGQAGVEFGISFFLNGVFPWIP